MNCSFSSCRLGLVFNLVCWISTITLVSYWIYVYTLDEDLCIVDYRKYFEDKSDEFPVLSICLKNHISEEKLKLQNPEITIQRYIDFLNGEIFDEELVKVNYKNVTIDVSNYVNGSWVKFKNKAIDFSTKRQALRSTYAFVHQRGGLYQCYELQMPKEKDLQFIGFYINSKALPLRNRSQFYEMHTYLHHPNHLFASERNIKYTWPKLDSNDGYLSRYVVKSVEIIKRRNKRRRPCMEWEDYDDSIVSNHIRKVGCRASYQKAVDGISLCCTKQSLRNASSLKIQNDHDKMLLPPCKYMGKILYDFDETDTSRTKYYKKGHAEIGIYFLDESFKQIIQTRYFVYSILRYSYRAFST